MSSTPENQTASQQAAQWRSNGGLPKPGQRMAPWREAARAHTRAEVEMLNLTWGVPAKGS